VNQGSVITPLDYRSPRLLNMETEYFECCCDVATRLAGYFPSEGSVIASCTPPCII